MPWADVQDSVKAMKGQLEITHPSLVIGSVRSQADEAARNAESGGRRQHGRWPDRRTRTTRPPAAAAHGDRGRTGSGDRAPNGGGTGQTRSLERTAGRAARLRAGQAGGDCHLGFGRRHGIVQGEPAARPRVRPRRQGGARLAASAGRCTGALAGAQAPGQGQSRPARRARHRRSAATQAGHGAAQARAGEVVQGGPRAGRDVHARHACGGHRGRGQSVCVGVPGGNALEPPDHSTEAE